MHLVKNNVKIIRQANDWKRTLEEDIFDKHWLSKLYTELLKKMNNSIVKINQRHFTKELIDISSVHLKSCSTSI